MKGSETLYESRVSYNPPVTDFNPDLVDSVLGRKISQKAEVSEELEVRSPAEEMEENPAKHFESEDDGCVSYSGSSAEREVETSPVSHPSDDPVLQQAVSALSTLSREVSSLDVSVKRITGQVSSLNDSLRKTHLELKDDLDRVRTSTQHSVDETRASLTSGEEVVKQLGIRLDSISAKIRPSSEFLVGIRARESETETTDSNLDSDDEERVRQECIAELMLRTELAKRNDEKESKMKRLYEKIYDVSPLTRCLLRYLQSKSEVQFFIVDSMIIGAKKGIFADLVGNKHLGFFDSTVADLKQKVVYLAGDSIFSGKMLEEISVGLFVMSLAQMCFCLVFDNLGLPYAYEDIYSREQIFRAMHEVKKEWGVENFIFDSLIKSYLLGKTSLNDQMKLVAAVPGMVAAFGPIDGLLRARRKMHEVTKFYEEHVMPALLREVQL